jgi:ABC-2 type transport system ATP-binding protein
MICVQDVGLSIHSKNILSNISFTIKERGITALVGENGAGKTTLIRLLSGYIQPTLGTIEIFDKRHPDSTIFSQMGVLSESPPLYDELKVGEYLEFIAQIRGVKDRRQSIGRVLELLDLQNVEDSYISTLSKGFRQRVGLSQALLHQPAILILDEPFIGLDPMQKKSLRSTLLEIAKQSLIILSSHNLDDIEQIASEILFIDKGTLKLHQDLSKLRSEQNQYVVAKFFDGISIVIVKTLLSKEGITKITPYHEEQKQEANGNDVLYTEFLIKTTNIPHHQVFDSIVYWARENQLHIEEVYRYKPRLEEILLS